MKVPVLKTVKELCLVCGGERWVADPLDPSRSVACTYCDALGWVEVSLPSLGEAAPDPSLVQPPAPPTKPSAPSTRKQR